MNNGIEQIVAGRIHSLPRGSVNLADKVIASYLEHYSLPYEPASRHHLQDCILSEIDPLLTILEKINVLACYASEEDTEARAACLLEIGKLAREVAP